MKILAGVNISKLGLDVIKFVESSSHSQCQSYFPNCSLKCIYCTSWENRVYMWVMSLPAGLKHGLDIEHCDMKI